MDKETIINGSADAGKALPAHLEDPYFPEDILPRMEIRLHPSYYGDANMTGIPAAQAVHIVTEYLKTLAYESIAAIHIGDDENAHSWQMCGIGTQSLIDTTQAACANALKGALLTNASEFILVHNHPDGIRLPSDEDIGMLIRLSHLAELVGVVVTDMVIVGRDGTWSCRAENPEFLEEVDGIWDRMIPEKVQHSLQERAVRIEEDMLLVPEWKRKKLEEQLSAVTREQQAELDDLMQMQMQKQKQEPETDPAAEGSSLLITEIDWDIEDDDPNRDMLPKTVTLEWKRWNGDPDAVADILSDAYGYCVKSFHAEPEK